MNRISLNLLIVKYITMHGMIFAVVKCNISNYNILNLIII